jgi:polyisoprenoid-binding protein YceI
MAKESWKFDLTHSNVGFSARHLMVAKVRGHFASWSGTLEIDEENPAASKVDVSIDAASIDTKEADRDKHLKSPDFLEVEKFPHITFKSTKVERKSKTDLVVTGDLTIRDTTRSVTLDVEYAGRAKDPWGGERVGFSATTSINRKDYGLVWNVALETGGFLVGDKIDIALEIEAIKA